MPGPPVVVPAVPGLMSVPGVEVCVPAPVPMGVTGDGGGAAEPGLVPAGDAPAPDPPYTPVAPPVPLWASAALAITPSETFCLDTSICRHPSDAAACQERMSPLKNDLCSITEQQKLHCACSEKADCRHI